jgi:trimeric autotransporter adhesin
MKTASDFDLHSELYGTPERKVWLGHCAAARQEPNSHTRALVARNFKETPPMNFQRMMASLVIFFFVCLAATAQQSATTAATVAAVPPLMNYASTLNDINGKPIVGATGITFLLYKDQQGGSPLWMETQTVTADESGHYSITLGSASAAGLPTNLFVAGESRWLAVQPHGEIEQPRVLLLSVPYALKAGDASTVGGLPASAFMLANSATSASKSSSSSPAAASKALPPANPAVTGKGAANYIPMWDSASDIINSVIFQKTSEIGIGTITPAAPLDVNGKTDIRDTLTLFPKSTDNILTVSGSTFKVSSTGLVTFISGQTFPGTGKGTITGVTTATGSGLSGGGTTGTLNLAVPAAGITNAMLQNSKITLNASTAGGLTVPGAMTLGSTYTMGLKTCSTNQVLQYSGTAWNCATIGGTGTITGVTAGTDLTGGGTTGSVTLNLDTTKVPQLAAGNNFTGAETFNGNVGIGTAPFSNTYTPLALGGANGFGTWLSLANTSSGGHTWNILSAGGANGEGAGNIAITDLTGASTIYLEGNVNVSSNQTVGGSAGGGTVDADVFGKGAGGGPTPGLRFGGTISGEGIASNRVAGLSKDGLDFYTEFATRMSILQNGEVGIGTFSPSAQLGVVASTSGYPAMYSQAGDAANGSGQNGSDGIDAYGSNGDYNDLFSVGGNGMSGFGGSGSGGNGASSLGGTGGVFQGGDGTFAGYGIYATPGIGSSTGTAGFFEGDIYVSGSINGGSVASQIDHPLDPGNKYLSHTAVESSDMKTMYDGTVTTDGSGQAVVELPNWFEALNGDFRYQLTTIGQPAQAWIASKIANHTFTIRTDKPNVELSWQVTGIRHDVWANAHRTAVEADKAEKEKGFYLHPEVYGATEEQGISWARNPELMKDLKERRLHPVHGNSTAKGGRSIASDSH